MVRLRPGSMAATTHSESNDRPRSFTSWWKVCPGAVSRSGASRTATVLCENSGRRRTSRPLPMGDLRADGTVGPVERVVVVGASLAGLRAAEALRRGGFAGTLTLVGAEEHLPYDRPPLSKQVLAGDWDADRVWLRRPDDYGPLGLDLRLGVRATDLDLQDREVVLHGGERLPFDGAIIATGA